MYNYCESTLNSLQIKASESFRELVAHRLALREDPFLRTWEAGGPLERPPGRTKPTARLSEPFKKPLAQSSAPDFRKRPRCEN